MRALTRALAVLLLATSIVIVICAMRGADRYYDAVHASDSAAYYAPWLRSHTHEIVLISIMLDEVLFLAPSITLFVLSHKKKERFSGKRQ